LKLRKSVIYMNFNIKEQNI